MKNISKNCQAESTLNCRSHHSFIKINAFIFFIILIQYAKIFFDTLYTVQNFLCCCYYCNVCVWLLENYWCLMVVNKHSYRMCAKIKKYVKILLLEFLNEDHILHFFLLYKLYFNFENFFYDYKFIKLPTSFH